MTSGGREVEVGRGLVAGGHLAQAAGMLHGAAPDPRPRRGARRLAARAPRAGGARRAARRPRLRHVGRSRAPRPATAPPTAWPATSTGSRAARPRPTIPWLLAVNQTVVDPARRARRVADVQDPHDRAVRASPAVAPGPTRRTSTANASSRWSGRGARVSRRPTSWRSARSRRSTSPRTTRRTWAAPATAASSCSTAEVDPRLAALRHRRAEALPHRRHHHTRAARSPGDPGATPPAPSFAPWAWIPLEVMGAG